MKSPDRRVRRLLALALVLCVAPVGAQNWQRVQGIDSLRSIHSLLEHDGIHYAGGDSLVFRSVDGLTWQPTAAEPVPGSYLFGVLASHTSGLYLGTNEDGVRRTTTGGASWTIAAPGLPNESVLALAVLGDSLFAGLGFSGVYVLNLLNPTGWTSYTTGLTQFGANSLSVVGNRLYAGLGAGFFVRARGAAAWTEINLGVQRQVYEVAAVGAARFAATEHGVYRALSDTSAWEKADITAMKDKTISALAVRGPRLYAALNSQGQHWIWSTDDLGATWDVRAHEFTELWDMRLAGNRMWAARLDGLWTYELEPVSVGYRAAGVPSPAKGRQGMWTRLGRQVDGRRAR